MSDSKLDRLKELLRSRAIDWIAAILIGIPTYFANSSSAVSYDRFFIPEDNPSGFDPNLAYPHAERQTVPNTELFLIAGASPLVVLLLVTLLKVFMDKEWDWITDVHNFILGFLQAADITILLTGCIKLYAGRKRPDYYYRLSTAIADEITEGERSYPSGHASFAFMGMTFLALYLSSTFKVMSSKTPFARFLITGLVPMFVAFWIAVSRTRDYVHNFSDINMGAALGFVGAIVGYMFNFKTSTDEEGKLPTAMRGGSL